MVSPESCSSREQIIRCGTDGHHNFVRALVVGALNVCHHLRDDACKATLCDGNKTVQGGTTRVTGEQRIWLGVESVNTVVILLVLEGPQ